MKKLYLVLGIVAICLAVFGHGTLSFDVVNLELSSPGILTGAHDAIYRIAVFLIGMGLVCKGLIAGKTT